jgi:MoaA/NifB/PqqE/SkfB family radical SAM enzyme
LIKPVLKNLGRRLTRKPVYINLNIVATNRCTQNCPMCNAELEADKGDFSLDEFKKYMEALKSYPFISCTLSGGEPTLVKDMPLIIKEARKYFPSHLSMITNLYGKNELFFNTLETALKENVSISMSFDGFGEVADKLRGGKNVSDTMLKNIDWLKQKKEELKSKSSLTLHTVISDANLEQVEEIMQLSQKLGFNYTVAPVNSFYYQDGCDANLPKITYSEKFKEVIKKVIDAPNNSQNEKFLTGSLYYAKREGVKLCPYLNKHLKHYKIFLEPGGGVYLCNRISLGNLNETPLSEMFSGPLYEKSLKEYKSCDGCWLECFVSPLLHPASKLIGAKKVKFDIDNI